MQAEIFPELKDDERFAVAGHIKLTFRKVIDQVKERVNRLFPQKARLESENIQNIQFDE